MKKTKQFHTFPRLLIWCILVLLCLCIIATPVIATVHAIQFRRADYSGYDSSHYLTYADVDKSRYARDEIKIPSGDNLLAGYLYGADSRKGVIIVSPGHRDPNDIKLYEIQFFVDAGWAVLSYDYTGCYNSEGRSMVSYAQAARDLDAVLTYVEQEGRFQALPILLFGHSLGAFASAAVLQYGHTVRGAVIASGFDTPREQWKYSIERYTGPFHSLLLPFTKLFISLKYGDDADLSAVDGIISTDIPVLVVSGSNDVFYGGESPIYRKRDIITNPNCSYNFQSGENHNGHYDYFLTDEAVSYQKKLQSEKSGCLIDKNLYMQHNQLFMEELNEFFLHAISVS